MTLLTTLGPKTFGVKPSLRVKLKVGSSPQYANVQSFYPDILTGDVFMSQSTKTKYKAEHTRIVRFDKNGNYKDVMILQYAGHGSSFFLYRDAATGKLMVVISWETTNSKREVTGRRVSIIPYASGTKAGPLRKLEVWNNWAIPSYDPVNNTLALRSISGNTETYTLRDWDDVRNGINKKLAEFKITRKDTFQGFTTINGSVYRIWGKSSGPKAENAGLEQFNWGIGDPKSSGLLVDRLNLKGLGSEFHSDYFEPEGAVYWPGYGLTIGIRVGGNNKDRFYALYNIGRATIIEDDDMPLTDADVTKIVNALKPVIKSEVSAQIKANSKAIASAVWETDGIISAGSYASKTDPEWMAKSVLTKILDNTKK